MSIDVNVGFIHPATVGNPPSGMTVINDDEPTPSENSWSLKTQDSKEFETFRLLLLIERRLPVCYGYRATAATLQFLQTPFLKRIYGCRRTDISDLFFTAPLPCPVYGGGGRQGFGRKFGSLKFFYWVLPF
jgi:hypothetical protein